MRSLFVRSAVVAAFAFAGLGAAHAEGLYLGGSLGTPHYHSDINGVSGNGSGVGGKLYGGYPITPTVAVEAGYLDLGHIDNSTGKVNVRGGFLDGVGSHGIAQGWSALGRIGVAQARFTTPTGNDWSPALKLGAGLQYEVTKAVALRAEYDHYHFTDAFDTKPNIGEFAFGMKVGF